jgi:hypothetical protein
MCAGKFSLKLMGGWAEGLACADPVARTPIGVSGNLTLKLPPPYKHSCVSHICNPVSFHCILSSPILPLNPLFPLGCCPVTLPYPCYPSQKTRRLSMGFYSTQLSSLLNWLRKVLLSLAQSPTYPWPDPWISACSQLQFPGGHADLYCPPRKCQWPDLETAIHLHSSLQWPPPNPPQSLATPVKFGQWLDILPRLPLILCPHVGGQAETVPDCCSKVRRGSSLDSVYHAEGVPRQVLQICIGTAQKLSLGQQQQHRANYVP